MCPDHQRQKRFFKQPCWREQHMRVDLGEVPPFKALPPYHRPPSIRPFGVRQSGVVIQNVMFQIERLWVRSLAPAGATRRGARGGGGGEEKGKDKASRSQSISSSPASAVAVISRSPSRYITSVSSGGGGSSWIGVGREGRVKYDSRSVLSPTLLQDSKNPSTTSVCTSCKQRFIPEENAWDSCRFEACSVWLSRVQ